jgi:RHS repeat-associated protein
MRLFSLSPQTPRGYRTVAGRAPARPAVRRRTSRPGVEQLEGRIQLSQLFTVPGAPGQLADVHFTLTAGKSASRDEVGAYVVQDAAGRVGSLLPSSRGYAAAALGRALVLFGRGSRVGAGADLTLPAGTELAFYLVRRGTSAAAKAHNPRNLPGRRPLTFFSEDAADPDHRPHLRGVGPFSWEDSTGKRDFRDVVFTAAAHPRSTPTVTPPITVPPVEPPPTSFHLAEGAGLVVQAGVPVDLRQDQGARSLHFNVSAAFDTADHSAAVEDVFNVYLVDPVNPSHTLLDRGEPGTALFSLVGGRAEFLPGRVLYDGSAVTIDLAGLTLPARGELVFQLLNNDNDTGTTADVTGLGATVTPGRTPGPVFPASNDAVAAGPALDPAGLTPAAGLTPVVGNVRLDPASGRYTAEVRLRNDGPAVGPLGAVVFTGLPAGVRAVGPSGTTAGGDPYFNFHGALPAGGLGSGGLSAPVEVSFDDPALARFRLLPQVLTGGPNRPPAFALVGPLTVTPGQQLAVSLTATDPDGDRVSFTVRSDQPLPTGILHGDGTLVFSPTPAEVGAYSLTLVAGDGAAEVTQRVTLTVAADPVTTTRLSGVVENTSGQPLAGVPVAVDGVQATTGADGSFLLDFGSSPPPAAVLNIHGEQLAGPAVYPFAAADLALLLGHDVYAAVNNVISRPLFLTPIDTANEAPIDPAADTTVTSPALPGAAVVVKAGTLQDGHGNPYAGPLGITEVPAGRTPVALPPNLLPDLVVTVQPGGVVFTTPAPLTLPNRAGWAADTTMDLWSLDPATGRFEVAGAALVSADGQTVQTTSGGVRDGGLYFVLPPAPAAGGPNADPFNLKVGTNAVPATAPFASQVDLHSGAVQEDHALVTYESLGVARGLTLHYDSLRADPEPILHVRFANVQPDPNVRLVLRVTVSAGNFRYEVPGFANAPHYGLRGGENFFTAQGNPGDFEVAVLVPLEALPTGEVFVSPLIGEFSIPALDASGKSNVDIRLTVPTVNFRGSPQGNGWGVAGLQQLVKGLDGALLLVDGDGSLLRFTAPVKPGDPYGPPEADFSTLVALNDGTYRRTLKDQTVYTFDPQGLLASVRDRNGNETDYAYDAAGRLAQVTDPAGLKTTLAYSPGRVTITDPADRVTVLQLDAAGDLVQITDPDSSTVGYGYDAAHHLLTVTDQRGATEHIEYGFHGRATQVTRKDGTVVQVGPVQTQGVFPLSQTSDPVAPPPAMPVPAGQAGTQAMVGYPTDVQATRVNWFGQILAQFDSLGPLKQYRYNNQALPSQQLDGNGKPSFLNYDARGNPSTATDSLSGAFLPEQDYGSAFVDQITVGDVNGDALPDVVAVAQLPGQLAALAVFPGTGGGAFAAPVFFPNPASAGPVTLVPVDVNSDGHLDVIVSFNNGMAVLVNNGDGTFGSPQYFDTQDQSIGFVVAGDFNGDGKLDVAGVGEPSGWPTLFVWLGNGDGSLAAPIKTTLAIDGFFNSLTIGDANGDGNLDLVIGSKVSGSSLAGDVLLGDGQGQFHRSFHAFETGSISGRALLADLNGDAIPDLVVSDQLWTGKGDGTFTPRGGEIDPHAQFLTDLDGDGTPDLIGDAGGSKVDVAQGLGNFLFAGAAVIPFSGQLGGSFGGSLDVADVNGDGRPDLLVGVTDAQGNGHLAVRLNSGAGLGSGGSGSGTGQQTFTWDPTFNRLLSQTDPLGRKTTNQIDPANGNVLSTTQMVGGQSVTTTNTYTAQGLLATTTDPLGRQTVNQYDTFGRLMQTTYATGTPDQATRLYEYDPAGNLLAVTDENHHTTHYTYDGRNRRTSITDPLNNQTTFTYDTAGNLRTTTDALGNTTTDAYDVNNRLLSTTSPDPDGPGPLPAPVTTYTYDAAGNQASVTDPLGHTTRSVYDGRNRLTEAIDALGNVTHYTYDANGNRTGITDPDGNTTAFAYDARNRLVRETDPLGKSIQYRYDAANNLTGKIDRDGREGQYQYDERNRLTTETWVGTGQVIHFGYDPAGNRTAAADNFSSLAFTYDNQKRLLTAENKGTPGAPDVMLIYAYDAAGNLRSVTDTVNGQPDGTIAYTPDALNRVAKVELSGAGITPERVNLTYDPATGEPATIDRYADLAGTQPVVHSTYLYDPVHRLTSLTHEHGTSTLAFYNFTYYPDGTIHTIASNDGTATYTYDPAGQLTSATYSNPGIPGDAFGWDAAGNPARPGIDVGPGNRLKSDGTFTYQYDNEGNPTLRTEIATGATRQLVWDFRNRLVSVLDKDGAGRLTQQVDFTYDALDRRIAKRVRDAAGHDVQTDFVYDRDNVLLDFLDPDGPGGPLSPALAMRYLDGPAVDQVFAQQDAAGHVLWLLPDHLGSTRDLADDSGAVVNHIVYDAFGKVVSQSNPAAGTRYLFTGRELDAETGLYYYRARYYDPATGRFLNEDPSRFGGGDVNLVRYVKDNPVSGKDPTGKVLHAGDVALPENYVVERSRYLLLVTDTTLPATASGPAHYLLEYYDLRLQNNDVRTAYDTTPRTGLDFSPQTALPEVVVVDSDRVLREPFQDLPLKPGQNLVYTGNHYVSLQSEYAKAGCGLGIELMLAALGVMAGGRLLEERRRRRRALAERRGDEPRE